MGNRGEAGSAYFTFDASITENQKSSGDTFFTEVRSFDRLAFAHPSPTGSEGGLPFFTKIPPKNVHKSLTDIQAPQNEPAMHEFFSRHLISR